MEQILISNESEVLVTEGLPDPLLPARPERRQVALVYQETVSHVASIAARGCPALRVLSRSVPDRESIKDLGEIARLYEWLAGENLGRQDTIVGVGGGALTDAAGFVGATWLRGVETVMIPTTLLAAVDAAIGGKTAVNVRVPGADPLDLGSVYGKNLVGAFWLPRRVVVDLSILAALPEGLLAEGTAEILKAGLIGDAAIVASYTDRGLDAPLAELVPAAIRVKAQVVAEDFRESGRRAILNYGHTIGHAVEALSGLPHGHAVAVGMVAEAAVSHERFGFDHRWLADLVDSLGLPVAAPGLARERARHLMERDKKRTADGIRMVLLRDVARPEVVATTDAEIELALDAIGAV